MKINVNNTDKLEAELRKVQKGCTARNITLGNIREVAENAEKKLKELGIPVKSRIKCTASVLPPKVCNSYKYTARGTYAHMIRGNKHWFVTDIERVVCDKASGGPDTWDKLMLTPEAKQSIPDVINI